jgi:hypothetical protein
MDTFIPPKTMVADPGFYIRRDKLINNIPEDKIDPPVVSIIKGISKLPYAFSLQSCCGHFIYGGKDLLNTDPLPSLPPQEKIIYRTAFIAVCLEDSPQGRSLYDELNLIPQMDEDYIQFGSAEWFWDLQVNSYILQVAPERFRDKDKMYICYPEALHVEQVRNRFLERLEELLINRTIFKVPEEN